MCFAISFATPLLQYATFAAATPAILTPWQPVSNVISGAAMPVLTNEFATTIQLYQWGLVPSWAKLPTMGKNMYNTKYENLVEKPALQAIYKYRRCLVPVTSFSVKMPVVKGSSKNNIPEIKEYYANQHQYLHLCGIWETWGEGLQTFSIITYNVADAYYPYICTADAKKEWLCSGVVGLNVLQKMRKMW